MKSLISSILFASLISIITYAQSTEQLEKLLTFQKEVAAKSAALSWIKKEPTNPEAYFQAGKVFSKLNSLDTALDFFNKGISVNSDFLYNHIGVIRVDFQKNNLNDVPALIEKVKDMSRRKDARFPVEMAEALLVAPDEYKTKIPEYTDAAIKLARGDYHIYLILGDYYNAQNNATLASENFQKAIDYEKNAYRAYVERGLVYERVKNYQEAESQYLRAIQADSTYPVAYEKLAEMYYGIEAKKDDRKEKKDYTKTLENYSKFVSLADPSLVILKRYASILYNAKEYTKSIEQLNAVIKIAPNDPVYLRLLAYSYYEMGDSVKSIDRFETFFKYVDKEKTLFGDYNRYGRLLFKVGKDSLAIENLKLAYSMDTTKLDILSDISKFYMKKKMWKLGIQYLEPVVNSTVYKALPSEYFELGRAYLIDSSYKKSKETFEKLLEMKPKLIQGWVFYSRAVYAMNPIATDSLTRIAYEKIIELADTVKFKSDLITAHSYLGSYFFDTDIERSKMHWQKVLELDPTNDQAIAFLKQQKTK